MNRRAACRPVKSSITTFSNPNRVLVAAAFFLFCGLTFAADALAHDRPFEARLSGNAHLTPTDDPFIVRNDETGTGQATHLGRFTWESVEYVDFGSIPGGVAVTGMFVMTAANGAELYGTYSTIGFPDVNGNLIIQGTFEFDGGTGRFQDAAGGGEISAEASLAPGLPFDGSLSGRIDY